MIGTTIGPYQVIEKVGEGGMGEVFLADDTVLQRKVALKFLPPALAESEEYRERFLTEARAAAGISHPNICVIHEIGEADGRPFIAMEYVEGLTLRDRIRSGSIGLEEAVTLFGEILAGLEEAHSNGVTHRDIKSSNVMVTAGGRAKIMDFGLARMAGGPAITKTLTTLGTVAYMSPEQAMGEKVDHRSDLWSAGVVFYEMLTGRLPFEGDRETAVVHHILNEDPQPIQDLKPPIPHEIRRIVSKALKKDLAKRYSAATEVLEELQAYREAVRAEEAGVLSLGWIARRLRRPAVAIPLGLAALAVGFLGVHLVQRQAEVRWAREEALPEIERMLEENDVWRNLIPPYRLAEEAEAILGDDPRLQELFSECAVEIDIRTEPAGADVFMKEYSTPEADWTHLGQTPLEGIRVPIGIFRWRLEKEGYEPVLAAESTWDLGGEDMIFGHNLIRILDPVGEVPEGMVRVAATQTPFGPLGDFFIGRHEVTNREYKAFVDAGGYGMPELWTQPFVSDGQEVSAETAFRNFVDQTGQPGPSTWIGGDYPQGEGDHPVSGVSWYEALAYAEWSGLSLPSVLHWNVARGAFTPVIRWPQLGGFGIFAPHTNFGTQGPVPVGSLPGITAYGAYDMPGNVREWCWNEGTQGRIIRGGAWEDNTYEFENYRQAFAMDRSPRNGFRLAHYPDPEAIPEAFFGPFAPEFTFDFRAEAPVDDAAFQIYREQFAYDPAPLNGEVERSWVSEGGWTHEVVSFDAAYDGERVLGHLFLPENVPPPYQTVVYFPGDASKMMPSSEGLEDYYEFEMFLSYLVRRGRAVFYPVYKGTFERGGPDYMALLQLPENWDSHAFAELNTQILKDLRRSIDYLETRPDIDAGRLAYYGMSWGGLMGAIVPAIEDRFQTSVLIAAGLTGVGRPVVRDVTYVHRVQIPTLILNGKYDVVFSPETQAKPLFDLLGTPPADKKLMLFETDHIPPRTEYIKETLAWLDTYLGPVRR